MSLVDPNAIEVGAPIWALARLFPPQGSWSSEEYLHLDAGRLIEFESGKLEIHALPSPEHQRLVLLIYRWLFAWSQQLPDPGDVFVAPLPIRLWAEKFREPDVVWVKSSRLRIGEYPSGADLVVEVTSPGADARKRDLVVKVSEYARAGIDEYWIVDTERGEVHIGRLCDGRYEFEIFSANQLAVSQIDSTRQIPVNDLFPQR
ncbi:MAG: Uma2 family endonuclease [Planctomycetaceae bacterium]|nr:Uma2 family endonuclease [Planctomycetaceae bacterium]